LQAAYRAAYIALGSNLEEPRAQVLRAAAQLAALPASRGLRLSSLYRSGPLAGMEQPDYINAVARIETRLTPEALLSELKGIETRMGRPPEHPHWGPRIIDLDLLGLGEETRASPGLTLPHPGIVQRNFVLYPLAEIAPDLALPGLAPVRELAARIGSAGLTRLPDQ
jgi:2-amino-4-hydroxy-6-hydroxymethyldihydropteridine diphosphokinase